MRGALLLASLLVGCGAPEAPDPCALAQAHLRECLGQADQPPEACDEEGARAIAETDCAALVAAAGETKADGLGSLFRRLACELGVLRWCPAVACEAAPVAATSCEEHIGVAGCAACAYYDCREAQTQCGPRGYYTSFGKKYCERFLLVLSPRMSQAGQRFLVDGRDCLMHADSAQAEGSCAALERRAIDAHVSCYAALGFCALPLSDKLLILGTVERKDLDLPSILRTALGCL